MSEDALVIFTPSGKRGRFALGTPSGSSFEFDSLRLDLGCPFVDFEVSVSPSAPAELAEFANNSEIICSSSSGFWPINDSNAWS